MRQLVGSHFYPERMRTRGVIDAELTLLVVVRRPIGEQVGRRANSTSCSNETRTRDVSPPMGKGAQIRKERAEKRDQEAAQLKGGKANPKATANQPPWPQPGNMPPFGLPGVHRTMIQSRRSCRS